MSATEGGARGNVKNIESFKAAPLKPWGIIATALWALLQGLIPVIAFVRGMLMLLAGRKLPGLDRSESARRRRRVRRQTHQ
jgi:hypothetical protein